jgi:hypothetical protein
LLAIPWVDTALAARWEAVGAEEEGVIAVEERGAPAPILIDYPMMARFDKSDQSRTSIYHPRQLIHPDCILVEDEYR